MSQLVEAFWETDNELLDNLDIKDIHSWRHGSQVSGGLAVFDDLFRNFFFREERPSSFEKQALQYYYIRGREGEKLSKNHKKRDGLVDQMKGIRVGGMDGSKVNMYNIDKDDWERVNVARTRREA